MKDLTTTNGRIPRATFWKFHAVLYGLLIFAGLLSESKWFPDVANLLLRLLMFPLPFLAIIVQIKRWHDRDKSGWWVFIALLPVLGVLWMLIECGFTKGTTGQNRFGPDPLET